MLPYKGNQAFLLNMAKAIEDYMSIKGEAYIHDIQKDLEIHPIFFDAAFDLVTNSHVWGSNSSGTIIWHNSFHEPS